MLATMLAMQ
jgi:hypothetical protein